MTLSRFRPLAAALAAALLLGAVAPSAPRPVNGPVRVHASEVSHPVDGTRDFPVPIDATHVELHWAGHPDAQLTIAFSADGVSFAEPTEIEIDESPEEAPPTHEIFGALIGVDRVRVARVTTDRPIARLTLLALDASGPEPMPMGLGASAAGATTLPTIIRRSQWGADETLRFDPAGDEQWPREYFPLQTLVVHHTAGRNNDSDPAATVRAIYYFHAVTRRWGDIGYAYLIDEAGRVYEGRFARDFWNGTIPSSDNAAGLAVAGGHAKYYNLGSMGIAVMGTFSTQAPTAAARASLVRMLAWAAAKYGLDPRGTTTYVNPQTGASLTTATISGHRNYQATSCPGEVLNSLLPTIRTQVAAAMNLWPGQIYNPQRTLTFSAGTYTGFRFDAAGRITGYKSYALPRASNAPTDQLAHVPGRSGTFYQVTAGVWAGYWVFASSRITLSPAHSAPTLQTYETARPLSVPPGTYVGRRFNTWGTVTASRTVTLAGAPVLWTTQVGGIPNQSGSWYYVTAGSLRGYWVQATAGMVLGDPPPPLPEPIAIYDPPRTLLFAAGTYTGYRYSAYGVPAGSYTYTLTHDSSAPTSRYSTMPGQTGNWYYIIEGVWKSYWIREGPGISLAP